LRVSFLVSEVLSSFSPSGGVCRVRAPFVARIVCRFVDWEERLALRMRGVFLALRAWCVSKQLAQLVC